LLTLALVMLASMIGCMRIVIRFRVKADGTADVRMLYAVSDSMASMIGEGFTVTQEELDSFAEDGVKCEAYSEDGYSGYMLSKSGKIDNASSGSASEDGMESVFNGNVFAVDGEHVTFRMDFLGSMGEESMKESEQMFAAMKNYGGYLKLTLELPSKPTTHNAHEVSNGGKTLTWDLTELKSGEVAYAEFDLKSDGLPWWLWVVIGVAAAAAIAAIAFVLLRKKKANHSAEEDANAPVEPIVERPTEELPTEECIAEEPAPSDPDDEDGDEGDDDGDGDGDGGGDGE